MTPNPKSLHHLYGNRNTAKNMENRAARFLKVQKNKATTKRGGRKPPLLKKLASYLKCDTFLYAPLVSPLPPDFPSPDNFASSAKVIELRKPRKERRCFLDKVEEFLKSDVYMYAPLLDPPHSPRESLLHSGMLRMDTSPRKSLRMDASPRKLLRMDAKSPLKVNQQTDHNENVNQNSESHLPQTDLSSQHTLEQSETVKHTVYQSCRPAAGSRNVTISTQLREARRVVVD